MFDCAEVESLCSAVDEVLCCGSCCAHTNSHGSKVSDIPTHPFVPLLLLFALLWLHCCNVMEAGRSSSQSVARCNQACKILRNTAISTCTQHSKRFCGHPLVAPFRLWTTEESHHSLFFPLPISLHFTFLPLSLSPPHSSLLSVCPTVHSPSLCTPPTCPLLCLFSSLAAQCSVLLLSVLSFSLSLRCCSAHSCCRLSVRLPLVPPLKQTRGALCSAQ